MINKILTAGLLLIGLTALAQPATRGVQQPNIVIIYADDLGFGDLSCYGATKIKTPNIDRVAAKGLRFTNAHASSATCTPSRYSLLTGTYAWRKAGTNIAPGDAALLIPTDSVTLPGVLKKAGYVTGVVGKWHLGLGPEGGPNWNGDIKPGPLEIGFSSAFLVPATGDRVPTVYVEDHRIIALDPKDPILISYKGPVGNEPTGMKNPELLKQKYADNAHGQTIINGVSRMGYMSGGKAARWVDEDMADKLTAKVDQFIETNKANPFFMYFATHDIHAPRMPNSRFVGKSGLGPRGDVIVQLDWCVGEVMKTLDRLGLTDKTLVIISSDNGPVVEEGYYDNSTAQLNGHTPAGPLRGGKYSAFDAGTRVPLIVRWPGEVKPGTSNALMSQVDLLASFAALTGQTLAKTDAPDSFNNLNNLLGKEQTDRPFVIEQSFNGTLSIIRGNWKYIEPHSGPRLLKSANMETGNDSQPQLYNLTTDIGEQTNVADQNPTVLDALKTLLTTVKWTERRQ